MILPQVPHESGCCEPGWQLSVRGNLENSLKVPQTTSLSSAPIKPSLKKVQNDNKGVGFGLEVVCECGFCSGAVRAPHSISE